MSNLRILILLTIFGVFILLVLLLIALRLDTAVIQPVEQIKFDQIFNLIPQRGGAKKPTEPEKPTKTEVDQESTPTGIPQFPIQPGAKLTGLQIAQLMTGFLDKTIISDGTFTLFYRCDQGKTCIRTTPAAATPHSGMIVLAYLDLYNKTQNPTYKQKADKATQVFLKQCLEGNADFCEWNFFVWFDYYQRTKDKQYLDAMLKVADRFLKQDIPLYNHTMQNHGPKLQMLYQVTGDKKYANSLIRYAQAIMAGQLENHPDNKIIYQAGNVAVRKISLFILWADIIPAYKVSKDERYLNFARDFYTRIKLSEHFREYVEADDQSDPFAVAIESLLNLADLQNPNDPYLMQAQILTQQVMDEFWDSSQRRLYDGDFAFVKYVKKTPNIKSTLYNGWLVRLFVKMDKLSFQL